MTKEEARKITVEPGEIIILSSGCYSDYGHYGVFKVLKKIDTDILIAYHAKERYFYLEYVVDKLVTDGYVERIQYKELYLGAYGDIAPRILTKD